MKKKEEHKWIFTDIRNGLCYNAIKKRIQNKREKRGVCMFENIDAIVRSRADGLELSVRMLLPQEGETCKGVVQILHGMSEHKDRYLSFMNFLADHGYASVIHDHRGHGKSVKSIRGLGFMYEVGMEGFMDDILLINEMIHDKLPDVPLTVFGHSMGSLAARVFLREHDHCMDKMIVSGPPSKNALVDMGIILAKLQKTVKGPRSLGKLLEKISMGSYRKAFRDEKSKSAWLCSDRKIVEAFDADPYCGFTFTVDGYLTLLSLLKYTYLEKGWTCTKPDMPILYLGGLQDPCIGGKVHFDDEMLVLKRAGYTRVAGKLYEGMRHEVCNERNKNSVYEDILKFL